MAVRGAHSLTLRPVGTSFSSFLLVENMYSYIIGIQIPCHDFSTTTGPTPARHTATNINEYLGKYWTSITFYVSTSGAEPV